VRETLVLGVFDDAASADEAVNNLTEQEFSERSMSVVMQDASVAREILSSVGPLGAETLDELVPALTGFGMSDATAKGYASALETGGALLAVAVRNEDEVRSVEASFAIYRVQLVTALT